MDFDRKRARPAHVFVGRQQELAAITAALAAARAGEPQVVLIQGEAGIGKSSLIAEFLDAQQDMQVMTASGEEAEAVLAYGVVQQLVAAAAAVSPGELAGLELLSHGPVADADALAVGVELLALISAVPAAQAVAVVVEDLQWADLASSRALLFACRRLVADHVLVILSCRSEGMPQLGEGWARFVSGDRRVVRLPLGGLTTGELGLLCCELGRADLSEGTLRRLADHTAGSPLLARALLAELTDEALKAPDRPLPAPASVAGLILPRLDALSQAARDLVAAASVLGEHCTLAEAAAVSGTTDPAAVSGTTDPAAALDEAERAGLLTEQETPSGWRISFGHVLVRQAVYGSLGAERRRQLHLRAASVVAAHEALTHRAAAAVGPDPELAGDLGMAAGAAAGSGKLGLAARYLQQAAAVTGPGPERDDRALAAFEMLLRSADVAAAEAARPAVEQLPASARRSAALGQLALLAARPMDAQVLLREAWEAHDRAAETAAGAEAALGLGILLGISGSVAESTMWLERALGSAAGGEPWYDAARSMRAIPFALSGDVGKALSLFSDLPERAAMVPLANTDSVTYRGLVKLWSDDLPGAVEDLTLVVSRIRAGLHVRFPGQPLAFLAETEFRCGRWDDAQGHADLAISLARDADRHYDLTFVHGTAAKVAACRGDWPVAAAHVEAAEDAARAFGGLASIFAASARAILGFARDDPEETLRGVATALAVPEIDRYDDPAAFWWRPMQVWALIRAERLADAEPVLAAFESRAAARGERSALSHAAWLRGLLAIVNGDLDRAEQILREGRLAWCGLNFPFSRALLDLEYGRCLARQRRRAAAIDAVRTAQEAFSTLGARPFMLASETELAGLGLRLRPGAEAGLQALTAQELRVARLVASGLSNRQVAAQLYVSPRTVEYHLASVFTKLDLRTRHQLTARVRDLEATGIDPQ
jgi:DNA-binding CsgD family transcriptional regulator